MTSISRIYNHQSEVSTDTRFRTQAMRSASTARLAASASMISAASEGGALRIRPCSRRKTSKE